MKRDEALRISGVTKHQYYYQPQKGKRGLRATGTTLFEQDGVRNEVPNEQVVNDIVSIQSDPDSDYGYRKMTFALMLLGYIINHKKVYRLFKEQGLLKERHKKQERNFVKYRKVMPNGPLEVLEMDIKFVWVEEYKRYAYILTVIDTFTRVALHWTVAFQIKNTFVKRVWEQIIERYLQPYDCLKRNLHIEIRNDNDSRFIAKNIQQFFKDNHLNQVFTHPYTPQENGHIESFHAILSQSLKRQVFWTIEELESFLTTFYDKYNNYRLHSSIAYLPPSVFWNLFDNNQVITKVDEKKKKINFKLKIKYQQLSGNIFPKGVLGSNSFSFQLEKEFDLKKEMIGAISFLQPSV